MKVKYRKGFLKDLSRIPSKMRSEIETFVFDQFPHMSSIAESGKVEQMTGFKSFYKIRFGPYRVGLKAEADTVIFERVLHRKEIYRYFP